MQQIQSIKEFGGYLNRYTHQSDACQCEMTFSVYLPPQAETERVPVLYYLSGLTCTDDNVRTKAGAQRYAAEHGIALVMPDTSPRGDNVPDEPERYDLGKGAGFYVNATTEGWSTHFNMYDYITKELPALVEANLPVLEGVRSITGHSMGGHGALICALKNEDMYYSVSAFAPIVNPTECPWGHGCFGLYLGDDQETWQAYDATVLIKNGAKAPSMILIDQGTADQFYIEKQLLTENFQAACDEAKVSVITRMQEGYDHSYHFIASFIGEHIAFHAKHLKA